MIEKNCAECKHTAVSRLCTPCSECGALDKFERAQPATNKYARPCKGATIDVYDVLKAFEVTNPAIAHAVKKLLAPGKRGAKSWAQDIGEAISSCKRGIEIGE